MLPLKSLNSNGQRFMMKNGFHCLLSWSTFWIDVKLDSNMFERRRFKCLVLLMFGVFIFGIFCLGYFCPDRVCTSSAPALSFFDNSPLLSSDSRSSLFFQRQDLGKEVYFDVEGDDVLVFLHIQKTGGTTFGRHLVKNTDISHPCMCYKDRKRCDCENSKKHIWLFSRYSTGWACGLHADWTELHDCVPKVLNDREGESRNRRQDFRKIYL